MTFRVGKILIANLCVGLNLSRKIVFVKLSQPYYLIFTRLE